MKVVNRNFVKEISVNNSRKILEVILNIPPDVEYLMINHLIIYADESETENLLNRNIPVFIHKHRENTIFKFNGTYGGGGVVKIRVKNPQNGEYEDNVFEIDSDGKCKKSEENMK